MKDKTRPTTPSVYIGLDAHKSSISVAYATAGPDTEPVYYGKLGGSNLALERGLLRLLKKLGVSKAEVRVAYEAGPTGFVAARRLVQLGYDTIVVAPSKVDRPSGARVKTDKRDALMVARLLRAGSLAGIHVPGPEDEAVRDVCRARTDASEDLRKSKQRLSAFLLRNGVSYTGKSAWTRSHMDYLRELAMPSPAQKVVLEEYLMAVASAYERVERIEGHMEDLLAGWAREPFVRALMAMRGFALVAAMTMVAELGDLSRFDHPRQLMAYLGLVPGEHSSGSKRRQGSITKCGNSHARWMLVECAQHYRLPPKVSRQLSSRQEGQPKAVRELSWRAQVRLHRRTLRLRARGLNHNKATVAVARELAGFLWEMDALARREKAA